MQHNIPVPNPAIRDILRSAQMRSMMLEKAEIAQAIYRGIVAKRTGRLAQSARPETFIGGGQRDRWCSRLVVEASYAASHEFGHDDGNTNIGAAAHDLNQVLNALGTL